VVRASAKRHALFEKIRHELLTDEENYPALASSLSLRPLCPTRWTVRAKSLASVADNYDAVLATLDAIAMEDKTESGSKANGLSKSFTRFILVIPKSLRQRKPKWPAKLMHPNDSYLKASVKTMRVVRGKMQKLV